MLINDHDLTNKGKIKCQSFLEPLFGFRKTFKKITKNIGFHITSKTAYLRDIIFTSIGNNINVMILSLSFFIPFYIPSTETQLMFNESIQNKYRISHDGWYSKGRLATDTI